MTFAYTNAYGAFCFFAKFETPLTQRPPGLKGISLPYCFATFIITSPTPQAEAA